MKDTGGQIGQTVDEMWMWNLVLFISGILTAVIGLILFTLEHKVPKKLAEFFLLDTSLDDQDDFKQLNMNSTQISNHPSSQNTPDTSLRFVSHFKFCKSVGLRLRISLFYYFIMYTKCFGKWII